MKTRYPVVGIGAVVWKDRNQVLMIRRGNEPGAGQWSIPGGKQEFGETSIDAAVREVREETGIVCDIVGLVGVYDVILKENDLHFTLINYAARWVSGAPMAGGDALEATFLPYDELASLDIWGDVRDVIAKSRPL